MKYLGIDYGEKRVGIATSDDEGTLAFPKVTVKNDKYLLNSIKEMSREEKIGEIVIGASFTYKGDPNKIMKDISRFQEVLKKEMNIPIHLEKEFLTSVEARRYQPPARKREPVDAAAAALILQRHLDKINQ